MIYELRLADPGRDGRMCDWGIVYGILLHRMNVQAWDETTMRRGG